MAPPDSWSSLVNGVMRHDYYLYIVFSVIVISALLACEWFQFYSIIQSTSHFRPTAKRVHCLCVRLWSDCGFFRRGRSPTGCAPGYPPFFHKPRSRLLAQG